jgi:hypothetical protein
MPATNSTKVNRMLVSVLRSLEKAAEGDLGIGRPVASRPKSRVGKKTIAGHFEPAVAWQFRKLALDRNTTVQKLLEESLADLFSKYHIPWDQNS